MAPTQLDKAPKYVMNMTEKMVNSLIQKTEDAITEQIIRQEAIAEELNYAKQEYERMQAQHDTFQAVIDEERQTLEVLIRYKTNDSKNKTIKVYKSISNTAHKTKDKKIRIPWMKSVIEVLKKNDRFIAGDVIYNLIVAEHPEWKFKTPFLANKFIKYYLGSGVKKGQGVFSDLVEHKGLIGLKEWKDGETIKVKYLNQFM